MSGLARGWCPGVSRPMATGDGLLVRLHPLLGILDAAALRAIAAAARRFGSGLVDVTARANLQLRGVTEADHPALAATLAAAGLGDPRPGGGPQRLTLTEPLAGLDPADPLDVAELAARIEAIDVAGLPPKVLVAVEGARRVDTAADLRLLALDRERVAIGLAGPDGATLWTGAEAPDAVPGRVAALLAALVRAGGGRLRDLPAHARGSLPLQGLMPASPNQIRESLPSLRGGLGWGRREAPSYGATIGSAVPHPCPSPEGRERATLDRSSGWRVMPAEPLSRPARELGLAEFGASVALVLELPFGRADADLLDRVAAWAERGDGRVRLAPRGLALAGLDRAGAATIEAEARGLGLILDAGDPRRRVAACPGAPGCASGTGPTQADAARLAPAAGRLGIAVHVSGCAKGCAHPGPAALTLVGASGGYRLGLDARAGEVAGPARDLGAVLDALGRTAHPSRLADALTPEPA